MNLLVISDHVVFLGVDSISIAVVLDHFLIANQNVIKIHIVRAMLHGISETPEESVNLQPLVATYVHLDVLTMIMVT